MYFVLSTSRDQLFTWTVVFHNHLNTIIFKPHMTVEDAKKKYTINAYLSLYSKAMMPNK
jgi:hypothetical protein